jgi:hypothetical protein
MILPSSETWRACLLWIEHGPDFLFDLVSSDLAKLEVMGNITTVREKRHVIVVLVLSEGGL